jgi:peptidoglycan hydrolase-like protein with peptidoglycan-binding domain
MANYNQLGYGSKGSEVTELQKLLNQNGYGLDVDGDFGSKTQAAVKDYQQKNNLAVDGIVGSNTWGALTKANTAGSAATSTPTQGTGFQYDAYQESDVVKQAQALLQQQLANKPGDYTSAWQTQLNDTLQKIMNREPFTYDINGDALYQQYKDQYMTQGQQAMMDTMGQAQAMTGGYGNSYAQSAGQQAYQGYVQQLNDKIPELYQLALSKYQMEGSDLKDQASLMAQMENQDYGRHRDTVADYNTELDRLQNRYDTERDYDYSKWADNRDFSYGQFSDDRAYDYQTGRDQVADKQWQAEFDEAVRQFNHQNKVKTGSSSSNSSTKKTTNNTGSGGYDSETAALQKKLREAGYDIAVDGIMGPKTQAALNAYNNGGNGGGSDFTGSTYSEAVAYMKANGVAGAEASGVMTQSEWQRRKNAGSGSAEVQNYSSYKDYLADYVEYKTSK